MSNLQELALKNYTEEVACIFCELFAKDEKNGPRFHKSLIKAIVQCFHIASPKLSKIEKAQILLEQLFLSLPAPSGSTSKSSFYLSKYIERNVMQKREIKHLLITLLYGLYYGDIDLGVYRAPNQNELLESLLIQISAVKMSPAKLHKIVGQLSLHKKMILICYAFKNYREGSYFLFRELEKLFHQNEVESRNIHRLLSTLVSGLKRNYFDVNFLSSLLDTQDHLDEHALQDIIGSLDEQAKKEVEESYTLFNRLIPLMSSFPERLFEEVEKLKAKDAWKPGMISISKKEVEIQREHLNHVFKSYFTNTYTLDDFQLFVEHFGLMSYPPLLMSNLFASDKLVVKLHELVKVFSSSSELLNIKAGDAHQFFSFIIAIMLHLDATCKNPSQYKDGFDHVTMAIATRGKELADTPALLTALQGLIQLAKFINEKLGILIDLIQHPIFVFDQSEEPIFSKNSKYIKKLKRLHKCAIIHISQKEALALAAKLNVEPLLDTTQKGTFGFCGARNCVFLLTDLLKATYKSNKNAVQALLEMDESAAHAIFQDAVLAGRASNKSGDTIFMIDDDMEIPAVNVFSSALFAKQFQDDYIDTSGFQKGRATKFYLKVKNLNEVFETPEQIFLPTKWLNFPTYASLSEHLCKPKICLNLPNGNEERHLRLGVKGHFFLQASTHLGGSRYPTQNVPTHFFVGLDEYFGKFIPYVLLIGLSAALIDSINLLGRSALPWNDQKPPKEFSNLKSVFTFIADERNKNELQRRFWRNVCEFFHLTAGKDNGFMLDLRHLMDFDIDAYIKGFQKNEVLDRDERASLEKIEKLYKFFQRDTQIFWKFGLGLVANITKYVKALGLSPGMFSEHDLSLPSDQTVDLSTVISETKEEIEKEFQIQLSSFPLTENLYLMSLALGNGNFCRIIKHALE